MAAEARSKPGFARPLADLVDSCLGESLAKQGFAGADIVLSWPDIVGETMARRSQPLRIAWPRKPTGLGKAQQTDQATLHVRVESAFALELQHLAPIIIERVNSYFGWACVGRLRLEQGPVGRGRAPAATRRPPSPEAVAAAESATANVADDDLRASLARLGALVIDRERTRTKS